MGLPISVARIISKLILLREFFLDVCNNNLKKLLTVCSIS